MGKNIWAIRKRLKMHLWRAAMDLLPIKEEIRPAWRYRRLKKNQYYTLFQKYTITKDSQ